MQPFSVVDCPIVIFLKCLSLVSITLFHVMVSGSMSRRENLSISSSVSSSGFCVLIPSLSRRLIWTAENFRVSFFIGTSLLYNIFWKEEEEEEEGRGWGGRGEGRQESRLIEWFESCNSV